MSRFAAFSPSPACGWGRGFWDACTGLIAPVPAFPRMRGKE